jgi:hypothetical protein
MTPAIIKVSRFLLVLIREIRLLIPGIRSTEKLSMFQTVLYIKYFTDDASNSLIHPMHDTSLTRNFLSSSVSLSIELL